MKPQTGNQNPPGPPLNSGRGSLPSVGIAGEIHREETTFIAVERPQALAEGGLTRGSGIVRARHRRRLPDKPSVLVIGERDLGKRQRRQREIMLNARGLGFLGAKEFPARRQVEKQLADFDTRARRCAAALTVRIFPPATRSACPRAKPRRVRGW